MNDTQLERISAWVDGELTGQEAQETLDLLESDAGARERLSDYLQGRELVSAVLGNEVPAIPTRLSERVATALNAPPDGSSRERPAAVSISNAARRPRSVPAPPSIRPRAQGQGWQRSRLAFAASVLMAGVLGFFLAKQVPEPTTASSNNVASAAPMVTGLGSVTTASRPGAVTQRATTSAPGSQRIVPAPLAPERRGWDKQDPSVQQRLRGYLVSHSEYLGRGMRGLHPYARVVAYAEQQQ